ncbi:hypothetical protein H9X85_05375 [Anaerotignum lactatifermentans]|uniref:Uncharacterized protein n=1 Tax=Anaerotignum lactatifermentans TaxID=160404 RepID=A0ABS2G970_9FIRM|nr:hypothetical protein [Anaerotignum lactatifermentans]MBM6829122.1 hypothetical protein [Anaerotignum lactatifermentans]MBM6877270.1 hypothetical protein [Anaerotignum lactatifermentans]MBM6950643.1 hypothetical protein [Anaerotignum lactatifermentans]
MWLFFGAASILFTLLHAYTVFDRKKGGRLMAFAAFGCTILTLFSEYRLISQWVAAEDWTALMDVVPYTSTHVTTYTVLLLLANGLILLFGSKKAAQA